MIGLKIVIAKVVESPRRPEDHPRYQAWLRKSYEDAQRTVERLSGR